MVFEADWSGAGFDYPGEKTPGRSTQREHPFIPLGIRQNEETQV